MKRMGLRGVIVAAGIMATATTFAADMTVGRFYARLAQSKQLRAADPAASESALRSAGYELPSIALDKVLTEGDIAAISTSIGLNVTTSYPTRVVSESQVDVYLTAFGSTLGSEPGQGSDNGQGTGGIDPGNSGNGKGKKKGHNKSTVEPD